MNTFWQDIIYGFRIMRKTPGFVAIAVLALALGIGANTAIFSIVNSILLHPLNYENSDQLMMVWEKSEKRGFGQIPTSPPNFADLRTGNQSFTDIGAFTDSNFNLTGGQQPERVVGVKVTATTFSLLGTKPLRGRVFLAGEDEPTAVKSLILSHHIWQRSFGSDENLVGKTVALNGESYTVIGIMPPEFKFPPPFSATIASSQYTMPRADLWVPLTKNDVPQARDVRTLFMVGRLKPGITRDAAQADMNLVGSRLRSEYPADADMEVDVVPLNRQVTGDIRPALIVLFGAVGFVLLIACANVANLLLAKASGRQKEVAVRIALGATRMRMIRQLLTESLLLSLAGGLLGSLLAVLVLRQLIIFSPANVSLPESIGIDFSVLGFALGISLLTSFIFGLAPALQASKTNLNETLKEGGRGSSGGWKQNRLRSLLVVVEVALALVLLIGSGLMIRSFLRLQKIDPGFNGENVLTLELELPPNKYEAKDRQLALHEQLMQRVSAISGVKSAATVNNLPFSGNENNFAVTIEGRPVANAAERPRAFFRNISPRYFETLSIPLRTGRSFTDADNANAPGVAIINETAATRFWPNEQSIGKRFKLGKPESTNPWLTVVGITGAVSHTSLKVAAQPEIYLPFQQNPSANMTLVVKTTADPRSFAGTLRHEVSAVDKDFPVANVKFMNETIAGSIAQPRVYALLLGIFGGLALLLAAIGIYGVMSYSVTQRTREVGIRMALGAQRKDVLKLIIKQAMILGLFGVIIGMPASFMLTRLIGTQLYGVSAGDLVTYLAVPIVLLLVVFLASLFPALKATRVDPLVAVRYE